MSVNTPFLKSPAFLAVAAGVVLAGAGLTLSTTSRHGSMPQPYSPNAPAVSIAAERMETLNELKSLDHAFQRLAEFAAPAVVSIKTQGKSEYSMTGDKQQIEGEGSGVILRSDGWIITNDHVVADFDKVTVILHDGREFQGTVRRAPECDIAVVKIDAKDLPTLPFADSSQVHVGQLAMAVGAPFGLENSVTYGHVSATGRLNTIPDQRTGSVRRYYDLLQTDASINMGNSGGPLINVDGQVIGINSAIYSLTGSSSGIGFAISSNLARTLADTLIEKGKVTRSYAGLRPENLKEFEQKELKISAGAILREVVSDGPAADAGLKAGDVVTQIGTLPVANEVDLRNAMFRYAPGTSVPFEIVREGQHKTLEVKLEELPAEQRMLNPTNRPQFGVPGVPNLPDVQGTPDQPNRTGKAQLGVQVQSMSEVLRKQFHIPTDEQGAVIMTVSPDSVASGLNLQPGDVIEAIGERKIRSADDLVETVGALKMGDQRSVSYARFGENNVTTRATVDVSFK